MYPKNNNFITARIKSWAEIACHIDSGLLDSRLKQYCGKICNLCRQNDRYCIIEGTNIYVSWAFLTDIEVRVETIYENYENILRTQDFIRAHWSSHPIALEF